MSNGKDNVLSSLLQLEELRSASSTVTRRGNLDLIVDDAAEGSLICNLAPLLPLTYGGGAESARNLAGTHDAIAAIALAAQHLNAGDGSVVPTVAELGGGRCPLRFGLREVVDTGLSESVAVDGVIQMTDPNSDIAVDRLPCAILGAVRSAVSVPTAIISGIRGYPQFSALSTADKLNDKGQYPLFGRTDVANGEWAINVLNLYRKWGVKHVAVVHVDDDFGNSFIAEFRTLVELYAPDMIIKSFELPYDPSPEKIKETVQLLKKTQFRYIYGMVSPSEVNEKLLEEAYKNEMAGNGLYNWILDSGKMTIHNTMVERGSPRHKYFNGVIDTGINRGSAEGGTPGFHALGKGLNSLLNDPRDVEYIRSLLPAPLQESYGTQEGFLEGPLSGSSHAAVMYDAVIAAGLASCNVTAEAGLPVAELELSGEDHFAAFGRTSFDGVTGQVKFDPITGSRDPSSAIYHLLNYVEDEERSNETHVVFKENVPAFMIDGEWRENSPIIFNDGTSNILPDLFPVNLNPNYLSPGMRAGGLLMCALVLLQAIGFAAWTWKFQGVSGAASKVVRASQPLFLHIICAGAFVMGSSIIPLSIDGGVCNKSSPSGGAGCDAACATFPWLLCLGFSAIFSALFTKTHRINIIFKAAKSFKRLQVTPADVAKPMVAMMGANILILGLWAGLDPVRYETQVVQLDPFDRELETYGFCMSDNPLPYLLTLATINVGSLAYAVYEAYLAKDMSTEYSESEYIFKAMIGILLVCFVGIPVMVIARDSPQAYFYVFSSLIFLVATLVLALIFIPKIIASKKNMRRKSTDSSTTFRGASDTSLRSSGNEVGESGGVQILSQPKVQAKLELENKELLARQEEYRREIEELNDKLSQRKEIIEEEKETNDTEDLLDTDIFRDEGENDDLNV